MQKIAAIVFPHQLFHLHPAVIQADVVFVVEHPLYFRQFKFHKQKLIFHRASMKAFAHRLTGESRKVIYVDSDKADATHLCSLLKKNRIGTVRVCRLHDDWLERDLEALCKKANAAVEYVPSPAFLVVEAELEELVGGNNFKRLSMASFYIKQRKRLGILVDKHDEPTGGKWSFDTENRKKLPTSTQIPKLSKARENEFVREAISYVQKNFSGNYGDVEWFGYPVTHEQAERWLQEFLKSRLKDFGPYEDAITASNGVLFHSLLSPLLNSGLLTPKQVIDETVRYASRHKVSLASLEGFVRQVIGWREFMMAAYHLKGQKLRSSNFWKCQRPMPKAFWEGTTGIDPIDQTIKRLHTTAYNHHIERLMMLGSFMLLCEIKPDDVYEWFMTMYIDAYDWVMVPNVYGMSQYADGGGMVTKPYICSSNYILKMSDYKKGEWSGIWDGLYWRFVAKHRDVFAANPRMGMMAVQLRRMDRVKLKKLIGVAEAFLRKLK